ncbi:putative GTP-binding protein OBGM, mitochondrial [Nicotiana tabacum]|uniref:GTP-binding protein OBGM, mitochondrial isoform X1 n=16 Tax=Nicotiana tabacum TaxID=4097 RepID=A0AC58SC97_TOBAC
MSFSQKVLYLTTLQRCLRSPWLTQTYSFSDIVHKKTKLAPLQERRMIDRFRIWAKGGDGGSGCTSIRRSRHDRRGTPDDVGCTQTWRSPLPLPPLRVLLP